MEKVEKHIEKLKIWKDEIKLLRQICLDCGIAETFKWGKPCYTFQEKNIVLIHGFKDYCALLFHKGVLLKDEWNVLIQQTENVQSARQLRFNNLQEIKDQQKVIKEYIYEAIEVEKAGLHVDMKKTTDYDVPVELESAFKKNLDFKNAFHKLTPGRQRGYLLYFSGAKQVKTRESRIENSIPKIFDGKGYNER